MPTEPSVEALETAIHTVEKLPPNTRVSYVLYKLKALRDEIVAGVEIDAAGEDHPAWRVNT